jgi:hypothetical protein
VVGMHRGRRACPRCGRLRNRGCQPRCDRCQAPRPQPRPASQCESGSPDPPSTKVVPQACPNPAFCTQHLGHVHPRFSGGTAQLGSSALVESTDDMVRLSFCSPGGG